MAYTDWRIRGPEFVNCNCAWGCPCQFNALPTHGNCRALAAMRIDEGHFGDVRLDGLAWAQTLAWPGAIHEGRGERQTIVDVRADARQREALLAIVSGAHSEPGATIFQVFSTVIDKEHEPLFVPIEFEVDIDKREARFVVPGLVEASGEPIRNPITGAEHRARVSLPKGFEYLEAEFGSGSTQSKGKVPLDLAQSYGQFAMLDLTPRGPVKASR